MKLLLILLAALVVIITLVMFSRFKKIDERVDDIFNKLLEQRGELFEHKQRLDAHIKNITSNQKRIDEIDYAFYEHTSKKSISNAYPKEERERVEAVIVKNYGKTSLRALSRELGIPATTINRWTKKLKESGVIA